MPLKGFLLTALLLAASSAIAQDSSNAPGLAPGATAPAFSATDQFGRTQSLSSLSGPKGLVLLFIRSADW